MHKIVFNISNKWNFLFFLPYHTINITYFVYKYSEIVLERRIVRAKSIGRPLFAQNQLHSIIRIILHHVD